MSMYYIIPSDLQVERAWEDIKKTVKDAKKERPKKPELDMWQAFDLMHQQDGTTKGKPCDISYL